jgi:hypothetical protein
MKTFNITAQAYDLCASNPKQSILINEVVQSNNSTSAKDLFSMNMLIEDIVIQKILSVEEISQVTS